MNKRSTVLLLIVLMTGAASFASDSLLLQNVYGRRQVSLNGRWNYIIDPYETGYYDYRHEPYDQSATGKGGFYDDRQQADKKELIEYDFDHSPTMKIPGDWNSQDAKLQLYEGTVWFRRLFQAARTDGMRQYLYFGAVNYECHVYLNGRKLGMHKGGFTPFQFDVTDLLNNGTNSLVVKADNTRRPDEIPTVNTDWWNYGGITRDVLLVQTGELHLDDYRLQLQRGSATVIDGFLQASGQGRALIVIPELSIRKEVVLQEDARVPFTITGVKPQRWTPENPKLYEVLLITGTDTVHDRIGFRNVETRGEDILLNGKSIFLRGISLHDENPLIPGRLRGAGDMRMMLSWAKELHCNYVRLAHYPHSEEMIRLADEMGLMVWGEIPVYWTISWQNAATYANAEKQLTDLITRDKNRASVIVWSIGNETPLSEPRHAFMRRLASKARSLDSSRLVAAALEVHRKDMKVVVDDPLGEVLDLVSFNEYAGWYWGEPAEMQQYGFSIKYKKPVVITEFGGDALGGFHADAGTRWSEEYQEDLYRNQVKWLATIPGLRGMTPWILTDFRSPRRNHPIYQDFWNRKGLYSETGKKKLAFFVLRDFYDRMEAKYR